MSSTTQPQPSVTSEAGASPLEGYHPQVFSVLSSVFSLKSGTLTVAYRVGTLPPIFPPLI